MQDLKIQTNNRHILDAGEYLVRPRLNTHLAQAIKQTLTIVCAGMGCGKTRAVYDFTQECKLPVMWLQFSDSDNYGFHFWETLVRAVMQIHMPLAKEYHKLGFPDTTDKLNMYFALRDRLLGNMRSICVLDDFHLVKDPVALNFAEQTFNNPRENVSYILISREMPLINIAGLMVRDRVSMINEEELNFTESELYQFLVQQGLNSEIESLSKIHEDTKGWAFITNFVARILTKTPGYTGYARDVIKQDILQLIEAEAWNMFSERLKHFFLRLSLTTHRSMELVSILSDGDESLISELKKQNAFVRYDRYIGSYRIHQLFLDFLQTKQNILTDNERCSTYKTIADWCVKNDFIVDALFFYEKIGDYESIVSILFASHVDFFEKTAQHIAKIFNRAPEKVFDHVDFSAAVHIHSVICTGEWQEALDLIRHYEGKYLALPEDSAFKNRMLGCIYYYWGIVRIAQCTVEDCYDFDTYFAKQFKYLERFPVNPKCWYQHPPSLWTSLVSSARAGAPQEYINALTRSMHYIQSCINGLGIGQEDLCQGELLFYQADINEAELYIAKAMERAREYRQYEIVSRGLFLIMRIAVFQGDYAKLDLALKDAERQLAYNEYSVRFLNYDIIIGWYYYTLDLPEKMPGWLKEKFTHRLYKNTLERLGNYIKAKYGYLAGNYTGLLPYLESKRQPGATLYERVESLAMEACIHLKINNKDKAVCILQEACEIAQPNNIIMPFIELGRDMRALMDTAEGCPECNIPRQWLKSIKQRASTYFRNKAFIISGYNKINGISRKIVLSPREVVILHDLRDGLSRSEIAAKYSLSINTVKLHINSIYNKLGARNRADIFRIAAENDLL